MPGTSYILNLVGAPVTEERLTDVPYPRVELLTHVTIKTVQAGAILGSLIIGPAVRSVRGPRTLAAIYQASLTGGRNGMLVGAALGPALTLMRMKALGFSEQEPYYDRSYRLRCNRNQVRVDRACLLGVAGGAGTAIALGVVPSAGAILGVSGGVLLGALYNVMIGGGEEEKKKKKKKEEKTE